MAKIKIDRTKQNVKNQKEWVSGNLFNFLNELYLRDHSLKNFTNTPIESHIKKYLRMFQDHRAKIEEYLGSADGSNSIYAARFPKEEGILYYNDKIHPEITQSTGPRAEAKDDAQYWEQLPKEDGAALKRTFWYDPKKEREMKIDKDKYRLSSPSLSHSADDREMATDGVKQHFESQADVVDSKKVKSPQPDNFAGWMRRKERPPGAQFTAMGMNAAAYAYARGLDGWNKKKWEWLHIRGAGEGGDTSKENLVCGTYDANSHMIPVEHYIKYLSGMATADHRLRVTWSVKPEGRERQREHAPQFIKIAWEWPQQPPKAVVDKEYPEKGAVTFDLARGTVFDKLESWLVDESLKKGWH